MHLWKRIPAFVLALIMLVSLGIPGFATQVAENDVGDDIEAMSNSEDQLEEGLDDPMPAILDYPSTKSEDGTDSIYGLEDDTYLIGNDSGIMTVDVGEEPEIVNVEYYTGSEGSYNTSTLFLKLEINIPEGFAKITNSIDLYFNVPNGMHYDGEKEVTAFAISGEAIEDEVCDFYSNLNGDYTKLTIYMTERKDIERVEVGIKFSCSKNTMNYGKTSNDINLQLSWFDENAEWQQRTKIAKVHFIRLFIGTINYPLNEEKYGTYFQLKTEGRYWTISSDYLQATSGEIDGIGCYNFGEKGDNIKIAKYKIETPYAGDFVTEPIEFSLREYIDENGNWTIEAIPPCSDYSQTVTTLMDKDGGPFIVDENGDLFLTLTFLKSEIPQTIIRTAPYELVCMSEDFYSINYHISSNEVSQFQFLSSFGDGLTRFMAPNIEVHIATSGFAIDPQSVHVYLRDGNLDSRIKIDSHNYVVGCASLEGNNVITIKDISMTNGMDINTIANMDLEITLCGEKNDKFIYGDKGNVVTAYSVIHENNMPSSQIISNNSKTMVFQRCLIIKKVDENGNPLSGAHFIMQQFWPETHYSPENIQYEDFPNNYKQGDTEFRFTNVSGGFACLYIIEDVVPKGYNPCPIIGFNFVDNEEDGFNYGAWIEDPDISTIKAGFELGGEPDFPGLSLDADGNFVLTIPNTPIPGWEPDDSLPSPLPLTGAPLLLPQIPGILLVGISILRKKRRREE